MTGAPHLVSVNVGRIGPFLMPRGLSASAIDKRPVAGRVTVGPLGLDGDDHAEKRFHGGPEKAVYAYAVEDLEWWSQRLGAALASGYIGENLTTFGIDLNVLHPGDELHLPDCVLRVTGPREPCSKLAARIGRPDFVREFAHERRTGVYCAVVRDGTLGGGDAIAVARGPRDRPSIRELIAERSAG